MIPLSVPPCWPPGQTPAICPLCWGPAQGDSLGDSLVYLLQPQKPVGRADPQTQGGGSGAPCHPHPKHSQQRLSAGPTHNGPSWGAHCRPRSQAPPAPAPALGVAPSPRTRSNFHPIFWVLFEQWSMENGLLHPWARHSSGPPSPRLQGALRCPGLTRVPGAAASSGPGCRVQKVLGNRSV